MKSPITTHILDTAKGRPAKDVSVELRRKDSESDWKVIATGKTNDDGRLIEWFSGEGFKAGEYQLTFAVRSYLGEDCFFPEVQISFQVHSKDEHYHVPLLLSPYGYSTYRGS